MKNIVILILLSLSANLLPAQNWIEVCNRLRTTFEEGNYLKAKEGCKKVLTGIKETPNIEDVNYFNVLTLIGHLYNDMGLYHESEKSYSESLNVIRPHLWNPFLYENYAANENALGMVKLNLGDFKSAKQLLESSLKHTHRSTPNRVAALNNLGEFYRLTGEYSEADSIYQQAINILTPRYKKHFLYATVLNNQGELYLEIGAYKKAEDLYQKSNKLILNKHGEDHLSYSISLNNLARLHQVSGRYQLADSLYQECIRGKKKLKNYPEYAISISNRASLYEVIGDFTKADSLYLESKKIILETLGKHHPYYAVVLNNLAGVYRKLGLYSKVEKLLAESLRVKEELYGQRHIEYSRGMDNLALFYQSIQKYDESKELLLKSLEIKRDLLSEENLFYASGLHALALAYQGDQEYTLADSLFKRSRKIIKVNLGTNNLIYASVNINWGRLYFERSNISMAEEAYKKGEEILKGIYGREHPDYATNLFNLAQVYENIDSISLAISNFSEGVQVYLHLLEKYFPGLSENQKLEFLKNNIEPNFQYFNSFVLEKAKDEPLLLSLMADVHLKSKGLILSSAKNIRNNILQSNDLSLLSIYEEWQNLRSQIASAIRLKKEEKGIIDLKIIISKIDSLEKVLSRKSQFFADQIKQTNYQWHDIKNNLEYSEASISFIDFRYYNEGIWTDTIYYGAIIVTPESRYPQFVKLCTQKDIENYLHYDLNVEGTYLTDTDVTEELYQVIWEPLLPFLKNSNKIHYSPSGLLNYISFHTLRNGKGKYLNSEFKLHQYSSLRDFITRRLNNKIYSNNSIVTFGGASFDQLTIRDTVFNLNQSKTFIDLKSPIKSWSYLDGTQREVRNITQLFQLASWEAKKYDGLLAKEEHLKGLSGKAPRILHIATHGFFLPYKESILESIDTIDQIVEYSYLQSLSLSKQPLMRSGLLLAGANHAWNGLTIPKEMDDGILTSYEIINQDLRNTELVILSACETGLGHLESTEGIFGLQRAFKQAGVDKIIMSLWNIPDTETVEFMELFYTYYLNGDEVRDAFTKTQKEMSEKYEPYYWGGFVLVE